MKKKTQYRIRNWREYNTALINRGSLTLWIDEEALNAWCSTGPAQRGAQYVYAEAAIKCVLTLRAVYHLALRATEGLARSVFALLEVALPVPSYTTLSRRAAAVEVALGALPRSGPWHLVIDSSGFKVYGEGEWKVRLHGWSKRRTWRKLHLGVDEATGEIVAAVASEAGVSDKNALPDLLEQVKGTSDQVSAEGAYDKRRCSEALEERGAQAVIPPRRDAKIWQHRHCAGAPWQRDENLRAIRRQGRRRWKQEAGYHRRSLAETTFFRCKTLFGPTLRARAFSQQATEFFIKVAALNRMTHLGMPDSSRLAAYTASEERTSCLLKSSCNKVSRFSRQEKINLILFNADLNDAGRASIVWSPQQRDEARQLLQEIDQSLTREKHTSPTDLDFDQAKKEFQKFFTVREFLEV